MASFTPPPTFADVVLFDRDGSRPRFNPIWLRWFLDVAELLPGGGVPIGTVTSVGQSFTGGLISVAGSPVLTTGTLALSVAGTSGGVPYFSSATAWASSAALATNQLVKGGGAGAAPATLGSLGTTTTLLHGNAAGAPAFSAVDLTADVSGILPVGNGGTGLAAPTGVYTPTFTNVANLTSSSPHECPWLRVGGSIIVSGTCAIQPTAGATATQLGISIPIASNLGTTSDLGGTAFSPEIASMGASVYGDITNDRAMLQFVSGADIADRLWSFIFMYRVI